MDGHSNKRRFLFLHTDGGDTISHRTRSKSLDSKVRRHLMADIGKSRRKPSKDLQYVTSVWPVAEPFKTQSSTMRGENSASQDDAHSQAPTEDLVTSDATSSYTSTYATQPILYLLSVFEKEWGEDWFSAYGFTLIMVTGKNAMGSGRPTNTFWFPFAFKKSAFLQHYQQIFTSPDVLIPLYRRSARKLRSLALERSLVTIQCVESRIASSKTTVATSDDVISAVLALACYNFTTLDFDQAMIHVRGIGMVIAARGGISTLEVSQDLMLMISWVDITAALIHDTNPLFPLPARMAGASASHRPGSEMLPTPLIGIVTNENTQATRFKNVMSCLGDLNALAILLQVELAARGDTIWDDEEQIGFFINPVTHRLLGHERTISSDLTSHFDVIAEALRLGAIIWIIYVKQRCHSYPGTATILISTLLNMLSKSDTRHVWDSSLDLQIVRFWLLTLCSINEPNDQDHTISMRMIASDMKEQWLASWDDLMSNIRQMPWIDIYEIPCAKLGQQLMEDYL